MTKLQVTAIQTGYIVYNSSMKDVKTTSSKEQYTMDRSQIVKLLQQYDVTPTRQRIEIAGYLFQRPQHLSAENILEGVNAEGNRVSRATVYNTMGLFTDKGLVREVLIDRERVFYDTNRANHHHVYDVDSGELHDVMHSEIEITSVPELPEGARIVDTNVILRVSSKAQ
jgi:Fur family iron response transcriptional regulator